MIHTPNVQNLIYVPRQFLAHVEDPEAHLSKLWRAMDPNVHIIDDEACGGIKKSIKKLQADGKLDKNSAIVSTVGIPKLQGCPLSFGRG